MANLQLVILFLKGVEARGVQLGVILLFDEGLSKQAHTKLVCL